MEELEDMLDPDKFFRISRSFYVAIEAIEKIDDYFGNRLILQLKPAVDKEALVSREKVSDFKKWMGKWFFLLKDIRKLEGRIIKAILNP